MKKNIYKSSLNIFFLFLVSLITQIAFSDSSSYYEKDAATVFPIKNKNIVLKREIVRIKPVYKNKVTWLASCKFFFYNKNNSKQLVTMGYPDWLKSDFEPDDLDVKTHREFWRFFDSLSEDYKQYYIGTHFNIGYGYSDIYIRGYQEGKLPYVPVAWNLQDLKVKISGTEVKMSHRPIGTEMKTIMRLGGDFGVDTQIPLGAFIWKVLFKPYETKCVNVSFSFKGFYEVLDGQKVIYILKTGALWSGNIGVADIYWETKGRKIDFNKISPRGFSTKGNVIHWHLEDFEPDEDITVFALW